MKISYNAQAMLANNYLTKSDNALSASIQRLSSGIKITGAKDNPSGLAMAKRMNSQIQGLSPPVYITIIIVHIGVFGKRSPERGDTYL